MENVILVAVSALIVTSAAVLINRSIRKTGQKLRESFISDDPLFSDLARGGLKRDGTTQSD